MFEHAVLVDAGFVGESIRPDDGFVRLYRDAGVVRDHAADAGDLSGVDAGLQVEDRPAGVQRHHHFFQRGVSSALADAIDGHFDLARPGADACQRVGSRQTQVVVAMHRNTGFFYAWVCAR